MSRHDRVALVTGGATVVFKELIDEALQPSFLAALKRHGFQKLLVQSGQYHETVIEKLHTLDQNIMKGIDIESFPFDSDLKGRMKTLRGRAAGQSAGVVISHAGELHPVVALSNLSYSVSFLAALLWALT